MVNPVFLVNSAISLEENTPRGFTLRISFLKAFVFSVKVRISWCRENTSSNICSTVKSSDFDNDKSDVGYSLFKLFRIFRHSEKRRIFSEVTNLLSEINSTTPSSLQAVRNSELFLPIKRYLSTFTRIRIPPYAAVSFS
ncbi:hypothetical protein CP061683_1067 [Chlamydia psittaci 06-1683]|nr:hypothetical protein CP061683_1067 [Chlamydia psittaci 06-1683]